MVIAYLAAIVAANLTVAAFGPAWSILNAFLFVGLDLTTRDALDLRWHGRWSPMLALIATGGLISWLLNRDAAQIALASTVAFLAASLVDLAVFRLLGDRDRWQRVNGSNVAGAAVDSVLFPLIAFGWPPLLLVMLAQFIAKVAGGAVWYGVLNAVSVRRRTA